MNYYSHNIGDYAQATMHLSLIEDAVYSRLLRRYYAEETPLVDDLAQLCRWVGARTEEEREAVEVVLKEFFELRDGYWHNNRADREIEAYQAKSTKAAQSAAKRWQPKKEPESKHQQSEGNATAMPTHSEGNANQEPITNNQEPITNKHISPAPAQASDADAPPVSAPAKPKPKARAPAKTPLPSGFDISDGVRAWAEREGHAEHLQTHFDHFVGAAIARGYTYANWDQALMNAIRADWAKVRERRRPPPAAERTRAEIDAFVNGPSAYDDNVIEMEVRRVGC